jgi:type II secretory pathway pseudopilin PulG
MITSKKWFSFIEIIVSIAIIIIISVVAVTTHSSMVDKTNNSKIVSDITTLENSITSYKNETSKFPEPEWNLKYFKEDTSYSHDMATAFWVSWYITQNTIPAKYLNYLPLDPKTGQYYALAVTKDEKSYEIAWVTKKNETYESAVSWNWKGEYWPANLVREYNWPNFVYNESVTNFPYNPEELLLTAKISNFSWSVLINWINYNDEILSKDLVEWDKIIVWTWSYAEVYFSDWSYSTLWDTDTETEIVFSQMRYKEKTNIFTNIKLALNVWSIWTKASKLWEKSEYEIYTTDTIAAVRWTIFWLRKNWTTSTVSVIEWKVEVTKINNWVSNFEDLTKELKEDNLEKIW